MDFEKDQRSEIIKAANDIDATLATDGWVKYIEPLIDKLIIDVLGGKVDGKWYDSPPEVNEKMLTLDGTKYLLGWKSGLITFHQLVNKFATDRDAVLKQMADEAADKSFTSAYEPENN